MIEVDPVAITVMLALALIAIAWLATDRWKLKAENEYLRERNKWQAEQVRKYVGNSICDVKWRSWTVTSHGVHVGLDPTERVHVSLDAEGYEAEKVITALREAGRL